VNVMNDFTIPANRAILLALQDGKHIYAGTVAPEVVAQRRARNRRARPMSLHLPHPHRPHVDPETRATLIDLGIYLILLVMLIGIFWIATYGGARVGAV
jgi:hypothetical protein